MFRLLSLPLLPVVLGLFFSAAQSQPAADDASYTLQPGDSLGNVAEAFDVTLEALMAANDLKSATADPGTVLRRPERPRTYTVQPGDTLYDLALLTGVSVGRLVALNSLEGKLIQSGQVLALLGETAEAPGVPLVKTIQQGDTLWEIARVHDLEVAALRAANGLEAGASLRPGDQLSVPGHFSPDAHDLGAAAAQEVTVREGDTLSGLASRYDTSVSALISANSLLDSRIFEGQRLRIIPGDELAPAGASPRPAAEASSLLWPLQGTVTSRFGYRELRVNGSNFHNALDIDGVTGDPVRAAATGTVAYSGWRGSYGYLVVVRAGNAEYRYAHNSELLVQVGDRVDAGDVLALVGDTGLSFGDHLHFEVRLDGAPVDPLPLLGGG